MRNNTVRSFLLSQGVTDETSLDKHRRLILDTEDRTGREFDLNGYRVIDSNPNTFPPMMG